MPHPSLIPGPRTTLLTSPPGEKRWGFYQFPDVIAPESPDKEIYAAVNVGHDAIVGDHEPGRFFRSRDQGKTWQPITYDDMKLPPYAVTFPDGSQVAFGPSRFIYHVHSYGTHVQEPLMWRFYDLGLKPINAKPLQDAYKNHDYALFRMQDISPEHRRFTRWHRLSKDHPWQESQSDPDVRGLLTGGVVTAYWWDKQGKHYAQDVAPHWFKLMPRYGPHDLQLLPDGTLVWPVMVMHPDTEKFGRPYYAVVLMASADKGLTWQQRAWVARDTHLTDNGYSADEHSLALMPNGDLYFIMRTSMGHTPGTTSYLAATRSTDGGFTWSTPAPIAPFSVTPFLLSLPNGMAVAAYGRPGVYLRTSHDSGHTWSDALPLVGPSEPELLKDRSWWDVPYTEYSGDKISCGNISALITGPDRFLLAYSDFRQPCPELPGSEGKTFKKAVFVQEFTVPKV
jgi:hypothetical protein